MTLKGILRKKLSERRERMNRERREFEKMKEREKRRMMRKKAKREAEKEMTPKSVRFGRSAVKAADWFFNPPQKSRKRRKTRTKKKKKQELDILGSTMW